MPFDSISIQLSELSEQEAEKIYQILQTVGERKLLGKFLPEGLVDRNATLATMARKVVDYYQLTPPEWEEILYRAHVLDPIGSDILTVRRMVCALSSVGDIGQEIQAHDALDFKTPFWDGCVNDFIHTRKPKAYWQSGIYYLLDNYLNELNCQTHITLPDRAEVAFYHTLSDLGEYGGLLRAIEREAFETMGILGYVLQKNANLLDLSVIPDLSARLNDYESAAGIDIPEEQRGAIFQNKFNLPTDLYDAQKCAIKFYEILAVTTFGHIKPEPWEKIVMQIDSCLRPSVVKKALAKLIGGNLKGGPGIDFKILGLGDE